MTLAFVNHTHELTYQKVFDYLTSSLFKDAMRVQPESPRFELLYQNATLIEVEVLPWEVHPWQGAEMAIVRAYSYVTVGNSDNAQLLQYLLAENRKMRFGSFQIDESGQVIFAHNILGGENMDLLELQTCILSVAAIASSYEDQIIEQFGGQRTSSDRLNQAAA